MDAQSILIEFVTATLGLGLALLIVLPLASALFPSVANALKKRLGATQGRLDLYFLDWRRTFF